MFLQGQLGVGLKLFGSRSLGASPFTAGLPGIFIVSTPPVWRLPLSQRLMVSQGDPEEFCDLLSGDAAVYCGERLQAKVLRIGVHGPHFRAGPLLTQPAVRSPALLTSCAAAPVADVEGPSEVAEPARFEPVEYQLEGARSE